MNTFGLGEQGRYRTNVWIYPGASGFHADRQEDLALHVTPKPVAMLADAILDVSHSGDIVLDVFGGSGSTLMAADHTGRRARLVELDPLYCDVICRRFLKAGGVVVRVADGLSFDVATTTPLQLEGPRHDDRKKGPYEAGYGKPPKSGQFKPGCWRPPNATASALSLRSRRPTLKTAGWCSAC